MGYNINVKTRGVKETISLGRAVGRHLSPGDVICLSGELGTGKTCFVKGLAEGLGIKAKNVTSPTFIIIREYKGKIPLYHIDLYRIGFVEDIRDIGMEEVIYGQGVTAIEWAEKISDKLPDERIEIALKYGDEKTRSIEMSAFGPHHSEILKKTMKEIHL